MTGATGAALARLRAASVNKDARKGVSALARRAPLRSKDFRASETQEFMRFRETGLRASHLKFLNRLPKSAFSSSAPVISPEFSPEPLPLARSDLFATGAALTRKLEGAG